MKEEEEEHDGRNDAVERAGIEVRARPSSSGKRREDVMGTLIEQFTHVSWNSKNLLRCLTMYHTAVPKSRYALTGPLAWT